VLLLETASVVAKDFQNLVLFREGRTLESKNITTNGITAGAALAMVISYTNWHSIGWAILHGCFSWGYVIYYAIKY
jgi:hypothetical protein